MTIGDSIERGNHNPPETQSENRIDGRSLDHGGKKGI